jgi:hypothetical protein
MMRTTLLRGVRILSAVGLATVASPLLVGAAATISLPGLVHAQQDATKDTIIFRDGKTVQGTILEETPTFVKMKVTIAGITSDATYQKAEILSVVKAAAPAAPAKADAPGARAPAVASEKPPTKAPPAEPNSDRKKIYTMKLTGWFGEDISETPIRNALKDAKAQGADVIIMELDNDWSLKRFGQLGDIKDDVGQFDQLFRAEKMESIFTHEIPSWEKPPQVVIWVKKAMGGAAFLPFLSRNIYFSSEGKMGGIGHLQAIFGSTGDEVVREKQFSLRLGHAKGKAIEGGYDPRIVEAMARDEYELSVKFEGGTPVLLEREPESPDEILLTDDGKEGNADNIEALARGEGDDCLTLRADIAYKLGISKGTADTLDDLVYQLGLSRTSEVVKGQADNIMKAWRDGIEDAKRQLPKMWKEAEEVAPKPPGGHKERTEARGRKKKIYTDMQQIEKRYEEALNPRSIRMPNWNDLETLKKRLELEQLADKPDRRR